MGKPADENTKTLHGGEKVNNQNQWEARKRRVVQSQKGISGRGNAPEKNQARLRVVGVEKIKRKTVQYLKGSRGGIT